MTPDPTSSPTPHREMPFTRVELAVLSLVEGALSVLLGKRSQAPYAGRWALPGGVLRIDLDDDLEKAAERTAVERLGTPMPFLRQLCAVGGRHRDPRAPWALSIVYRGLVPQDTIALHAGKRLESLTWRPVEDVIADTRLAFDHAVLIARAVQVTRDEVTDLDLPREFLPGEFTLGELQATCEALLGQRLDKSSFRRKLADRSLVEPVPGAMKTGAFRPAQLHRFVRVAVRRKRGRHGL